MRKELIRITIDRMHQTCLDNSISDVEKIKVCLEGLGVLKSLKPWCDEDEIIGQYNLKFSNTVNKTVKKTNGNARKTKK